MPPAPPPSDGHVGEQLQIHQTLLPASPQHGHLELVSWGYRERRGVCLPALRSWRQGGPPWAEQECRCPDAQLTIGGREGEMTIYNSQREDKETLKGIKWGWAALLQRGQPHSYPDLNPAFLSACRTTLTPPQLSLSCGRWPCGIQPRELGRS